MSTVFFISLSTHSIVLPTHTQLREDKSQWLWRLTRSDESTSCSKVSKVWGGIWKKKRWKNERTYRQSLPAKTRFSTQLNSTQLNSTQLTQLNSTQLNSVTRGDLMTVTLTWQMTWIYIHDDVIKWKHLPGRGSRIYNKAIHFMW